VPESQKHLENTVHKYMYLVYTINRTMNFSVGFQCRSNQGDRPNDPIACLVSGLL